jgi:hypothetical protein
MVVTAALAVLLSIHHPVGAAILILWIIWIVMASSRSVSAVISRSSRLRRTGITDEEVVLPRRARFSRPRKS